VGVAADVAVGNGQHPQLIFWKDKNSVYLGCNRNFAQVVGVGNMISLKTDYDFPWTKEEANWYRV